MGRQIIDQKLKTALANTACPFEREKAVIKAEFADERSDLSFEQAWLKIDEVEQRQSDQM